MMNTQLISLTIMGGFYIFTGITHFRKPNFFLKITPKWVPYPEKVNILVGIIEILLGVALFFSLTRDLAIWGIIALLIAVFPANIYHFQQAIKKGKLVLPTLIRLPIQLVLIYWAYSLLSII